MSLSATLTRNNTLPDSSAKADFYQLIDGTTVSLAGTAGTAQLDLSTITQTIVMTSKAINEAQGTTIPSASTTDIGAATGNYVVVSGVVTITALGTVQAGTRRIVEFSGILTLTHNATSLILPGAANITTAAGDCAMFMSEGSGNWRCVMYQKASGAAVAGATYPTNYRSQLHVMQASTTTMTIAPGIIEVNAAAVQKTSNTTLTVSTAGDWAGGSSLRAVSTLAYVGIDASGNIKMHTTAPTHADYALSVSAANNTKRYVSWSGTTYRVIGWFYMNATGAGELDSFGVSNIADGNVKNRVYFETGAVATGTTALPNDDTIPQNTEGDQYMSQVFRATNVNNQIKITVFSQIGQSANDNQIAGALFQDATANALAAQTYNNALDLRDIISFIHYMKAATIALTTFKYRAGGTAGTTTFNGEASGRKLGGVIASSICVEEEEAQLT